MRVGPYQMHLKESGQHVINRIPPYADISQELQGLDFDNLRRLIHEPPFFVAIFVTIHPIFHLPCTPPLAPQSPQSNPYQFYHHNCPVNHPKTLLRNYPHLSSHQSSPSSLSHRTSTEGSTPQWRCTKSHNQQRTHWKTQTVPWRTHCRELTTLWVARLDDSAELKVTDPKEQQGDVEEEEAKGKERRDGVDWASC